MKAHTQVVYRCKICGYESTNCEAVEKCESRAPMPCPVQVGDKARVTGGQCAGEVGTVESISYADRDWGHYAADRYWHTPLVHIELAIGHRQCTFDQFEPV